MQEIACYIRVSSKGQDYATQRDALERAIPAGFSPIWYQEKQSAKTSDRTELKRLLTDTKAGKYSAIYCFKLDRLARSGVSDTFRVIHEIRESRTTLHAVADNLAIRPDREDLASECVVFALSLAARLEFTARNDRIAAARTRIEAKGGSWGRPKVTSKKQDDKCLELHKAGRTVREIAMALGIKRSTAGRAIKRAMLTSTHEELPPSTPTV
jgi:DNA invertase Pin-like site-specific DNA recombinase